MTARWIVQATVAEPTALIQAFVAHYLALGADAVHLALDAPDPDQIATLSRIPGVHLTPCDAAHWARRPGGRPGRTVPRQVWNVRRTHRQMTADWLLFCDADEFLIPDRPLGDMLAAVPPDQPWVRIPVAERAFLADHPIQTLFDGPFRLARPDLAPALGTLFGADTPLADLGFTGHLRGKSAIRANWTGRIGIHAPGGTGDNDPPGPPEAPERLEGAVLLHFDGLTPLHLLLKSLRWYDNGLADAGGDAGAIKFTRKGARSRLIAAIHAARGDAGALARIVDTVSLTPAQATAMRSMGALTDIAFDPGPAVRAHLPPPWPDLTPAAFDAALRAQLAPLIARWSFAG